MKLKKLLSLTIIGAISMFGLTGCLGSFNLESAEIVTTVYPLQYLVNNLVTEDNKVITIYPAGTDTDKYELTSKQNKKYSSTDILVYNGLSNEKKIALDFINTNKHLNIIDCSQGMSVTRDVEELWLSPANYLMLAQNIKLELEALTNARITQEEIESNYEKLKLTISSYDADLKLIASEAINKSIVAGNDVFEFLEKYGFNVLSVEENDNNKTDFQAAKTLINDKSVSYVFVLDTDEETPNVTALKDAGATIVKIKGLKNLTEEDKKNNIDYETVMNEFIENIRTEVYN